MRVNMKGVRPWGNTLASGAHVVKVAEASESESKHGYPKLTIRFEATDGSGGVTDFLVVSDESRGRLGALLAALHSPVYDAASGTFADDVDLNANDLVGHECLITVSPETYDGKSYQRVQSYSAVH